MSNKIEIINVSKTIKGNKILQDVNLEIEGGKIYGLYGVNGSGKTMLLRLMAGLIKPDKGSVIINEEVLHEDLDYPRSIGIVIENPNFWDGYSGIKALMLLASIKKAASKSDVRKAMVEVGLDPDDKKPVNKYSLGMKQKLGIAQALMERPEIILLDEPTNALDRESAATIRELLKREAERGAIVVIASHVQKDLEICDVIIGVENGCIVKQGIL